MRRWSVRPCLEALEARTLPSTAWSPPAWIPPATLPVRAVEVYIAIVDAAQPAADWGNLASTNADPDVTPPEGPGLDRLLQDVGQQSPVQDVPIESIPADYTASTPVPVVAPRPHSVAAVGGDALNTGPVSTPLAQPSTAPAAHGAGNVAGDLIPGFSQLVTPASSDATPTGGLPVVTTFLPASNAPSAESIADAWTVPQAPADRDASSVPPNAELPTVLAAWQQTDDAVTLAQAQQAPQVPTSAVWAFADVGPAPGMPPLDSTEAVAIQAGVNPGPAALADGALLERFVTQRDQAAFTTLVARYERLVFSICQRVLGDAQAAEDAVQATFLVLAQGQRARSAAAADWLALSGRVSPGVATGAVAARRRRSELRAARRRPTQAEQESAADLENQEIYQVLREELQRLPEKNRVPLMLCYFRGQTHAEAADTIGMPRGSIAKCIGEGLQRLRQRLTDRGIAL